MTLKRGGGGPILSPERRKTVGNDCDAHPSTTPSQAADPHGSAIQFASLCRSCFDRHIPLLGAAGPCRRAPDSRASVGCRGFRGAVRGPIAGQEAPDGDANLPLQRSRVCCRFNDPLFDGSEPRSRLRTRPSLRRVVLQGRTLGPLASASLNPFHMDEGRRKGRLGGSERRDGEGASGVSFRPARPPNAGERRGLSQKAKPRPTFRATVEVRLSGSNVESMADTDERP